MSILSKHPLVRWSVPVVAVALAVGGTALITQLTADAVVSLPPRSAAQLLVDVQTAKVTAISGTVVQKADLGLPQLPNVGAGAGSSDLASLITGNHTLRVWYAGPAKARVALVGTLGESDVIRNGSDLWIWSSDGNSASHRSLPPDAAEQKPQSLQDLGGLAGSQLTPQQTADAALAAIDPTTTVTTDGAARVAGRKAYELVLAPKDATSLVGQVRIAVDAARHVPLRVQVFAKNSTSPSFEVGFTQISFERPADSQFRFSPPPGVKVSGTGSGVAPSKTKKPDLGALAGPSVSGSGWGTVLQATLPASAAELTGQYSALLKSLPKVSGSWGSGQLLRSKMFSVLLVDNGRVLVGAVPPEALYKLAAEPLPASPK